MSARTPFSFTHLQKRGIVILLSIISGIFQLQYMYFTWLKPSPNVFHIPDMQDHPVSMQLVEINTATPEEWKKLPGIGSVLSQRIVKYRQAIQGFSEIEDLHSVYGLSDSVWVHMKPYLYLDSTKLNVAKPSSENTFYPKSWSDFEPQTVSPIGINTADTNEWKTLPGIGQVLSKRIVKFRAIKKGFSQIEELKKVYGLPEDTYQQILPYLKLDTFALKMDSTFFEGQDTSSQKPYFTHDTAQSSNSKNHYPAQSYSRSVSPTVDPHLSININVSDSASLKQLPGVDPGMASRIIKYRSIIGYFAKKEYLQSVYGMNPKRWELIKSHIFVGDLSSYPRLDLNMVPEWKFKYYPFWNEEQVQQLIQLRTKLRRIDRWEELNGVLDKATLSDMKLYFKI